MKIELDRALCKEFPNLYADRHKPMDQTAMCWGFDCGDGWFYIIHDLSEKLEKLIVEIKEKNPNADFYPCASQVKEKYGELRFYMSTSTDEMEKLIAIAEKKSRVTCELCGKKGKIKSTGWWLSCRCAGCRKDEEKARES